MKTRLPHGKETVLRDENTTAYLGTRYEGKIVGDSPEMCRALGSHGFCF